MEHRETFWRRLRIGTRRRMISGLLILIPLAITLMVLRFFFNLFADNLAPPIRHALGLWDHASALGRYLQPGGPLEYVVVGIISIVLLACLMYLLGFVGTHMLGRRILTRLERMLLYVPIVKTVYSACKQVVEAVSLPNKAAFKSVVLVEFPFRGCRTLGFVTGQATIGDGKVYHRIFIPAAINPMSGYVVLLLPQDVQPTTLTVEEAFKTVVSGGILAPEYWGPPVAMQEAVSADRV